LFSGVSVGGGRGGDVFPHGCIGGQFAGALTVKRYVGEASDSGSGSHLRPPIG
jgi:hypothetical protein